MNLRSHMRISFVAYDGFCHWTEGGQKALYHADNGVCVDRERRGGLWFGSGAEFWGVPMRKSERIAFYEKHFVRPFGISHSLAGGVCAVCHITGGFEEKSG